MRADFAVTKPKSAAAPTSRGAAEARPVSAAPPATHFLMLQSLPGPFFRMLAQRLRASGRRVSRIQFNGGDVLDWRLPGARSYRGGRDGWRAWLRDYLTTQDVTDVVLFGDCRPLHRDAIDLAGKMGRRVHVFEEGYLRPNHVTLERTGVNGFSHFPNKMTQIRALAQGFCESDVAIRGSFPRRVRDSTLYYIGVWLMTPGFWRYRSHRQRSFLVEGVAWFLRFCRAAREEATTKAALAPIAGQPFFLIPLQLDGDSQLLFHSPFASMSAALEVMLRSFAAHAPTTVNLVIKMHPLDPDTTGWRAHVTQMVEAAGVGERVAFIERGDLDGLLAAASGVVTVNSTVGPLALAAGTPVLALGTAIFRVDGLTAEGPLDAFWAAPGVVDADNVAVFRRALKATALVNGGFHSKSALDLLVTNATARLLRA